MSTTTTHYALTKPAGGDRVEVAVLSQNFDTIDGQLYFNSQERVTANGDGVNDATATLIADMSRAVAAGITLVGAPSATYLISSTLTLPADLRFDLNGATIKRAVSFTTGYMVIGSNANVQLFNGTFDGNSVGTSSGGSYGIDVRAAGWVLRDITVQNCVGSGIVSHTGAVLTAYDCISQSNITDLNGAGADGFELAGGVVKLFNCQALNNYRNGYTCSSPTDGQVVQGFHAYNNGHSTYGSSGTGFKVTGAGKGVVDSLTVEANYGYGVYLSGACVSWQFGSIVETLTGNSPRGTRNSGTAVEILGGYNRIGSLVGRDHRGYLIVFSGASAIGNQVGSAHGSQKDAGDRDPGISFQSGASKNVIGHAAVYSYSVGCVFGEAATVASDNEIGALYIDDASYGGLRYDGTASYNHIGRVVARDCYNLDGAYPGLLNFTGTTTGNVIGWLDNRSPGGTHKPTYIFSAGASTTGNIIVDGISHGDYVTGVVNDSGSNVISGNPSTAGSLR